MLRRLDLSQEAPTLHTDLQGLLVLSLHLLDFDLQVFLVIEPFLVLIVLELLLVIQPILVLLSVELRLEADVWIRLPNVVSLVVLRRTLVILNKLWGNLRRLRAPLQSRLNVLGDNILNFHIWGGPRSNL